MAENIITPENRIKHENHMDSLNHCRAKIKQTQ